MKIKYIILVLMIIFLLGFTSCTENKYCDIDTFKNRDFSFEQICGNEYWVDYVYDTEDEFLPKYDEIEYSYSNIEFYVWLNSISGSTHVLELCFDDVTEYENAKNDIYSKYELLDSNVIEHGHTTMPTGTVQVGEFLCKIVSEGERYDYPHNFSAICVNEEQLIIRYFFYFNQDLDVISSERSLKRIFEQNTDCKW